MMNVQILNPFFPGSILRFQWIAVVNCQMASSRHRCFAGSWRQAGVGSGDGKGSLFTHNSWQSLQSCCLPPFRFPNSPSACGSTYGKWILWTCSFTPRWKRWKPHELYWTITWWSVQKGRNFTQHSLWTISAAKNASSAVVAWTPLALVAVAPWDQTRHGALMPTLQQRRLCEQNGREGSDTWITSNWIKGCTLPTGIYCKVGVL